MITALSQPHQDPKELASQLHTLLQEAFDLKKEGSFQQALEIYKEIDKLTLEPAYPLDFSEESLKSGELEYGLAFRILDYGEDKDAEACWQKASESAKASGNTTRWLFCLGRLCLLDICHFKDIEGGKIMTEGFVKEYPKGLFFVIINALAQTTEEEFQRKFRKIPESVMKKTGYEHLDVFQRDYERAEKMLKSGVDKEHWRKIARRYKEIVKKMEDTIAKAKAKKENEEGGWRSNWASKK